MIFVFPVAKATVERAFSAMKIYFDKFGDKIGNNFLNNSLVCYVICLRVKNEIIMQYFHNMGKHKLDLPSIVD